MTFGEMSDYIGHISDGELVALCNDIHEWRYESGELPEKTKLRALSKKLNFTDIRAIEYAIVEEAHRRYETLVLLLMKDAPAHYLKLR